MARNKLVTVFNTLTEKYADVPETIVDHPIRGAHLTRVIDPHDVPCDCGPEEGESVDEPLFDSEGDPAAESLLKEIFSSESLKNKEEGNG